MSALSEFAFIALICLWIFLLIVFLTALTRERCAEVICIALLPIVTYFVLRTFYMGHW